MYYINKLSFAYILRKFHASSMNFYDVVPYQLKIPAFSDVMSLLHFIQVFEPIISSRIIRSQVEETNDRVALIAFMFILNISVKQTQFIYNRGSISRNSLTITLPVLTFMTVNNVKSFTQALTYTQKEF